MQELPNSQATPDEAKTYLNVVEVITTLSEYSLFYIHQASHKLCWVVTCYHSIGNE
jgi:hypothetical protein